MSVKDYIWVEKYRPSTLDGYIFHDEMHKECFEGYVESKAIPHLLFAGAKGSGKTTIAKILINQLGIDDIDVLTINASDERGIDVFRDVVRSFASSAPMGDFKVVLLEEADALTPIAQDAFRFFMEEVHQTVRFILTCNHINKLNPMIVSRCTRFEFKAADVNDITERMVNVLVEEQVEFDLETLDAHINAHYPDIRAVIQSIQQRSITGQLKMPIDSDSGIELSVLIDIIQSKQWPNSRVVLSKIGQNDWDSFYRYLYQNIDGVERFKDSIETLGDAYTTIADSLYKHSLVADPEINALACIIMLCNI